MAGWEGFSGINRGYVLELYEKYRQDPASVDPATRAIFEQWTPPAESATPDAGIPYEKIVGELQNYGLDDLHILEPDREYEF